MHLIFSCLIHYANYANSVGRSDTNVRWPATMSTGLFSVPIILAHPLFGVLTVLSTVCGYSRAASFSPS